MFGRMKRLQATAHELRKDKAELACRIVQRDDLLNQISEMVGTHQDPDRRIRQLLVDQEKLRRVADAMAGREYEPLDDSFRRRLAGAMGTSITSPEVLLAHASRYARLRGAVRTIHELATTSDEADDEYIRGILSKIARLCRP